MKVLNWHCDVWPWDTVRIVVHSWSNVQIFVGCVENVRILVIFSSGWEVLPWYIFRLLVDACYPVWTSIGMIYMAKHTFLDLNHTGFSSDSSLSGFPAGSYIKNSVSHESSPIYFWYEHFLIIIFIIILMSGNVSKY